MGTHDFYIKDRKPSLSYIHFSPDLALGLALSGSHYLCLEQIYIFQKNFELLRCQCIDAVRTIFNLLFSVFVFVLFY